MAHPAFIIAFGLCFLVIGLRMAARWRKQMRRDPEAAMDEMESSPVGYSLSNPFTAFMAIAAGSLLLAIGCLMVVP